MSETRPAYDARVVIDSQCTEKDFQQLVVDFARLNKWFVYFTWRAIHSPAGYPDLTLCKPPRLIWAELKTERGKLTVAQEQWLDTLRGVPGAEVYVWRPSDWPAIERIVRGEE